MHWYYAITLTYTADVAAELLLLLMLVT